MLNGEGVAPVSGTIAVLIIVALVIVGYAITSEADLRERVDRLNGVTGTVSGDSRAIASAQTRIDRFPR
jgi:hypothetical protein